MRVFAEPPFTRYAVGASGVNLQREPGTATDNVEAREPGDPLRDASESGADAANIRVREMAVADESSACTSGAACSGSEQEGRPA